MKNLLQSIIFEQPPYIFLEVESETPTRGIPNPPHKRTKFKGYMRENRRVNKHK